MTNATSKPDVGAFIRELGRKLREKKLTMLDAEILAALEAKQATREQIAKWAKDLYAATGALWVERRHEEAEQFDDLLGSLTE